MLVMGTGEHMLCPYTDWGFHAIDTNKYSNTLTNTEVRPSLLLASLTSD